MNAFGDCPDLPGIIYFCFFKIFGFGLFSGPRGEHALLAGAGAFLDGAALADQLIKRLGQPPVSAWRWLCPVRLHFDLPAQPRGHDQLRRRTGLQFDGFLCVHPPAAGGGRYWLIGLASALRRMVPAPETIQPTPKEWFGNTKHDRTTRPFAAAPPTHKKPPRLRPTPANEIGKTVHRQIESAAPFQHRESLGLRRGQHALATQQHITALRLRRRPLHSRKP